MQEARSEHIMEGFRKLVPTKCHVIREGASLVIDASDLVPGDLVEVVEGDKVPADLRLTSANDLMVRDLPKRRESEGFACAWAHEGFVLPHQVDAIRALALVPH